MTAYRFQQLKNGASCQDEAERQDFERELQGEKRSQAAYQAVSTKRKKYKLWPTRPRKETYTSGAGI